MTDRADSLPFSRLFSISQHWNQLLAGLRERWLLKLFAGSLLAAATRPIYAQRRFLLFLRRISPNSRQLILNPAFFRDDIYKRILQFSDLRPTSITAFRRDLWSFFHFLLFESLSYLKGKRAQYFVPTIVDSGRLEENLFIPSLLTIQDTNVNFYSSAPRAPLTQPQAIVYN